MNPEQPDYDKPVAYDSQGRPLYAHPPTSTPQTQTTPQSAPQTPKYGDDTKHADSKQRYPNMNLSQGEYVVDEIRRNPIGLVPIFLATGVVIVGGLVLLLMYPAIERSATLGSVPAYSTILLPIVMVMVLAALLGYVAATVYLSNKLFLTNESMIEETQTSLFAHKEQTVSLANIEEVTYHQETIFQNWFNFGTLRLTIEGDHIAQIFQYVGNPKERADEIVNAIETFKFGHPGAGE